MAGAPAATTPVLLDTNAYLRLAKRVRPLLGVPFGQKRYVLTIRATALVSPRSAVTAAPFRRRPFR